MAFTVVPDKASGDIFQETMWDASIRDNINKGAWRPVADSTLGGNATSISLTSISSEWEHLLLFLSGACNSATSISLGVRFNGDAGANYDYQFGRAVATTVTAAESFAQAQMVAGLFAGTATASSVTAVELWMPCYSATDVQKICRAKSAFKLNTSASGMEAREISGFWRDLSPITQIDLLAMSGTFIAGTRATLFGLGG